MSIRSARHMVVVLWGSACLSGCMPLMVSKGMVQPRPAYVAGRPGFAWSVDSTPAMMLYRERDARLPALPEILSRLDEAEAHVLAVLGETAEPGRTVAFAVASRERMQALIGRTVPGRAFYGTRLFAFIPVPGWERTAEHELTHIVASRRWGRASEQWVSEGLATLVGNPWVGQDLHAVAYETLFKPRVTVPLNDLFRGFHGRPDWITYLQSASVVKFLSEQYGMDAVRAVWVDGVRALPKATGRSIADFENEWRAAVLAVGEGRN